MSAPPFLPYTHHWIDESDLSAVQQALSEGELTRGPQVAAFEEAIAAYCDLPYAVAFNSGTSALHAAYWAGGVGPQDLLITSPNTFVGSVVGALSLGTPLLLAEVDPCTGALDLEKLPTIRPPTRGRLVYLPIHFAGAPLDLLSLHRQIRDPNALIIEDAAQAFGALDSHGRRIGSCYESDMAIFSFHPSKTITTGEGGMVVTRDRSLFERLRLFRNNGIEWHPPPAEARATALTGNFHLTDLQATLGISQLNRVEEILKRRRHLTELYAQKLTNHPHIQLLQPPSKGSSACHLMVVRIPFQTLGLKRSSLMERLKEKGIGTQFHHPPLWTHPACKPYLLPSTDLSGAEQYASEALSLPLYATLKEEEVERICGELVESIGALSS